jgi:hypothetical protein
MNGSILIGLLIAAFIIARFVRPLFKRTAAGGRRYSTEKILAWSRENMQIITMVIVGIALIVATVLLFRWFPGLMEWIKTFFIPWGLITCGTLLFFCGIILAKVWKKDLKFFAAIGAVLGYLIVMTFVIWLGRGIGSTFNFSLFGSTPYVVEANNRVSIGVHSDLPQLTATPRSDGTYQVYVPLQNPTAVVNVDLKAGSAVELVSITPVNAAVNKFRDNGWPAFGPWGPQAPFRGVLNYVNVREAREYEASLRSTWQKQPVLAVDIPWVVLNYDALYGEMLVILDGKAQVIAEHSPVRAEKDQPLLLGINFEKGRHAETVGGYSFAFRIVQGS